MSTTIQPQVVANVISVNGMAFARNADGAVRRLMAGDVILEGETVFTLADGQIELAFADGHSATILGSESYLVGPEALIATSPGAGEAAITAAGEIGQVVQALQQGGDILENLDPTAAGPGGGGGEDSGNSFVRLLRIVEPVTPVGYEFPVNSSEPIRAPEGDAIPEEENGQPSAGGTQNAVDEDDINPREQQQANWVSEFETDVGIAYIYNPAGVGATDGNDSNSDEGAGDDLNDPSPTVVSGLLNASYGSDGPGDIKFDTTPAGLTSGGAALQYWISDDGHTVVGYVPLEGEEGGYKIIFSAEIVDAATGAYTFTLYGALDHGVSGTEDNLDILLGFTVTDSNNDTAAGTLNVNVDDDIPAVMAAEPNATVEDEELGGIDESSDATPDLVAQATGNVSNNGNWGADGFGSIAQIQVGSNTAVNVPADGSVTVYFAQDGSYLGTNSTGAAASLVADSDGSYTFTLLDNMLIASGQGELVDSLGTVSFLGVDGDGDPASVSLVLEVKDDVPSADIADGQGSVTIDETSGLQDNDTSSATVSALFAGLTGVSTDMTQFAQSASSLVDTSGSLFGADTEGATTALSLSINGGDGTDSGLETTDGTQIFLYQENGLIVGRIGNEVGDGTDTANADGEIAFAIAIAQDGTVSVAQYASITNPTPGDGSAGTYDETASLTGLVNAVVTVTDGDGDTSTDFVGIGDQIFFSDDGPTAVSETTQQIYEGFTTTVDALAGTVDVPASNATSNFVYVATLNNLAGGDRLNATWTTNGSTTLYWELRPVGGGAAVASGTGSGTSLSTVLSGLLATGNYELWVDATNKALTVTDVTFEHDVTSSVGGNVLSNGDSFGADEEGGIVSAITYVDGTGSHTIAVESGGTTVNTLYGTLTILQDGSYIYQANADAVPASDSDGKVTDSFTYTIMDGDGDTATAAMNFDVLDVPDVVPSAAYFTVNTSNTGGGGDTGFQQFQISITGTHTDVLTQTVEVANEEGQQDFFISMGGDVIFQNNAQYAITLEHISGSAHLNFTDFSITDKFGNTVTLNGGGGSDNVTLTGDESSSYDGVVYIVTVDGGGNISVAEPVGYDLNTVSGDDVLVLGTPTGQLDFSLDMDDLPIGTTAHDTDLFGQIDRISISGVGEQEDNTLTLSAQDVLDLVDSDNTLWVNGDTGDAVVLSDSASWTQGASNVAGPDGGTYTAYTATVNSTLVTLYVENDVSQPMP